jgi:hypothetical protein
MRVLALNPGEHAMFNRFAFALIAHAPEIALTISFVIVLFACVSTAPGLA